MDFFRGERKNVGEKTGIYVRGLAAKRRATHGCLPTWLPQKPSRYAISEKAVPGHHGFAQN